MRGPVGFYCFLCTRDEQRIDMIAACVVAVVCIRQVLPALQQSSSVLLQKAPELIVSTLDKSMKEVAPTLCPVDL